MPQLDAYHHIFKRALAKDGWTITHDPFVIQYGGVRMMADLGAEKVIAAEKEKRLIAVEVKVFGGGSFINKFHEATGQYGNYRALLQKINPNRRLYLAVSDYAYLDYFCIAGIQEILTRQQIKLVVFNPRTEEILQWME